MKLNDIAKVIIIAITVGSFFFMLYLMQDKPTEIVPDVNPLASELKEANRMIDMLVSFNNLLIKDLEACQDGRTIKKD